MVVKHMIAAAIIAALLTIFFHFSSRPYDRGMRLVWFYLVVLSAALIGGYAMQPVGPQLGGVYWLPFLSAGLLSALLAMLLQARNFSFGRRAAVNKIEQGAWARQIERVTSTVLRVVFAVVATLWMMGFLFRFVL